MSTYYAVTAGGAWSSASTWGTASGGSGGAGVPTASDDVILDANSGNVSLTAAATCRSLDCMSATGNYIGSLTGNYVLSIGISSAPSNTIALRFSPGMTLTSVTPALVSTAATQLQVFTSGISIYNLQFTTAGSWLIKDNLNVAYQFAHTSGTLNLGSGAHSIYQMVSNGTTARTLNLGSSTISITSAATNAWLLSSSVTLSAGTSTIIMASAFTAGSGISFVGQSFTYNAISFNASNHVVSGANTFASITAQAGVTVNWPSATTQTLSNASGWHATGSLGAFVSMVSTTPGTQWTLSVASGNVASDYLSLQDAAATGGATFNVGGNGINVANNTGWTFAPWPTPAPNRNRNVLFSVLQMPVGSLAAKRTIKAIGCTHTTVAATWASLQPNGAGTALATAGVNSIITEYQQAAQVGLKVFLELQLHYPPSWVVTGGSAVEQFVDQYGYTYAPAGGTGSGEYMANWQWTALGWQYVSDLITKLATALGPAIIAQTDSIKCGGGAYGELHFPSYLGSGKPNYSHWGYGSSMQSGGSALALGQTVCPNPGYVIYSGTSAQDAQWLNWYLNGMGVWLMFFIGQMRAAGWNCDYHVCHPGYGLRNGLSTANSAWRQSAAACEDSDRMIAVYGHDPKIWPYCTWLDIADGYDPPAVDSDIAAWKKIYNAAYRHGKTAKLWGENTGSETGAQLAAIFSGSQYGSPMGRSSWTLAGGSPYGYNGMNWLSYAGLVANNSAAHLSDYQSAIAAFTPSA